jgi:hypothetical protein
MDVTVWLRSLGLERYEAAFRENAIDRSVLPDLTDQDLEKLGVLLGHRRKLLRAIAELSDAATTAVPTPPPVTPAPIPIALVPPQVSVAVEAAGERRHITVMFCDLAGSTGISDASPYSVCNLSKC